MMHSCTPPLPNVYGLEGYSHVSGLARDELLGVFLHDLPDSCSPACTILPALLWTDTVPLVIPDHFSFVYRVEILNDKSLPPHTRILPKRRDGKKLSPMSSDQQSCADN